MEKKPCPYFIQGIFVAEICAIIVGLFVFFSFLTGKCTILTSLFLLEAFYIIEKYLAEVCFLSFFFFWKNNDLSLGYIWMLKQM